MLVQHCNFIALPALIWIMGKIFFLVLAKKFEIFSSLKKIAQWDPKNVGIKIYCYDFKMSNKHETQKVCSENLTIKLVFNCYL